VIESQDKAITRFRYEFATAAVAPTDRASTNLNFDTDISSIPYQETVWRKMLNQ
jgi:hypothetical protein